MQREKKDRGEKKGKKENEQNMRKSYMYNMSCIHLINMMTTIINIIVLL